jgi:hypothetical protein
MDDREMDADLVSLLGRPLRPSEGPLLAEIGREWGVAFPEDFVSIAGAYGDVVISGFIFFCGAREIRTYADLMGHLLEQSDAVPCRVLPSPGGALLWGNTIEGDQLFLVDRGGGRWTVSAFRRGWADWHDTDLEFGEWFPAVLAGEIETDWMPEWPPLPHSLEIVE